MRIIFEIIGGPYNGVYVGESDNGSTVKDWYHLSLNGQVGAEFLIEHQSSGQEGEIAT